MGNVYIFLTPAPLFSILNVSLFKHIIENSNSFVLEKWS